LINGHRPTPPSTTPGLRRATAGLQSARSAVGLALVAAALLAVGLVASPGLTGPASAQSTEATPTIYLSATNSGGSIAGIAYDDEDIIAYDVAADSWSMVFDGSDVGLAALDIDGFRLNDDGTIDFTIREATGSINGIAVDDTDTIRFTPGSLGADTAGTFAVVFDPGDLSAGSEDVNALATTPDGRSLLSTIGVANVTGAGGSNLRVNDEDAIVYDDNQGFSLFFDGSDVALPQEDVVGLWVDDDSGDLFLAAQTAYQVPGLVAGDGDDILRFTGTVGAATSGTYSLFFDGDTVGLDIQIDGLHIEFSVDEPEIETVAGTVVDGNGDPIEGIRTNLFTENRASFLGAADTGVDGGYGYELPGPGCYVVTFIAPEGDTWAGSNDRFLNRAFCAAAGEAVTGIDAELVSAGSLGAITGTILDESAAPVAEVKAVLYAANASGGRGQWLGPAFTGTDGVYSFSVTPGCFVVDLVAPDGLLWATTNAGFKQFSFCVAAGETVSGIEDVLVAPGSGAFLTGTVIDGTGSAPTPVAGIRGVLYEENPDGSRGRWLGPAFTGADGVYTFEVDAGCYLIDLVAPADRVWQATAGGFKRLAACVDAGATTDTGTSTLVAVPVG
jgi:hypothetical protein